MTREAYNVSVDDEINERWDRSFVNVNMLSDCPIKLVFEEEDNGLPVKSIYSMKRGDALNIIHMLRSAIDLIEISE